MRIARILGIGLCCACSLLVAKESKKKSGKKSVVETPLVQLVKPLGQSEGEFQKGELNAFKEDEKCSRFIRSCEMYAKRVKEFNKRTLDLKKSTNPSADKIIDKNAQRLAKVHNKCIEDANEVLKDIHKEMVNLAGKTKGDENNPKMLNLCARERFVYDTLKEVEKEDLTLGGEKKIVEPQFGTPKKNKK